MQPISNFFSNAQQQISKKRSLIWDFFMKNSLFSASLYTFQDALLYQPNEPESARTIVQTPDTFHMPYETITIDTGDNVKLHGFLIKQIHRTNERETLIFFHGNAGNIGHRWEEKLARRFVEYFVFLSDYKTLIFCIELVISTFFSLIIVATENQRDLHRKRVSTLMH